MTSAVVFNAEPGPSSTAISSTTTNPLTFLASSKVVRPVMFVPSAISPSHPINSIMFGASSATLNASLPSRLTSHEPADTVAGATTNANSSTVPRAPSTERFTRSRIISGALPSDDPVEGVSASARAGHPAHDARPLRASRPTSTDPSCSRCTRTMGLTTTPTQIRQSSAYAHERRSAAGTNRHRAPLGRHDCHYETKATTVDPLCPPSARCGGCAASSASL